MMTIEVLLASLIPMGGWLLVMAFFFTALSHLNPCNTGARRWHRGMVTDLGYFFFIPFLTRYVRILFFGMIFGLIFMGHTDEEVVRYLEAGYGPIRDLPLSLQAILLLLISDFMLYWLHRSFHGRRLWKFHAIHHSSEELDWYSSFRFHPVNTWLTFTLVDVVLLALGFSPMVFAMLSGFNILYSGFVHANLNYSLGPFKRVLASPVFHRWHHTHSNEGGNCNFAPTFPFLDVMFGTFYMPEGKLPQVYGVDRRDVPPGFIDQLLYPFRKSR